MDVIWLDEEPPEDIYAECLLRTMDTPDRPEGGVLLSHVHTAPGGDAARAGVPAGGRHGPGGRRMKRLAAVVLWVTLVVSLQAASYPAFEQVIESNRLSRCAVFGWSPSVLIRGSISRVSTSHYQTFSKLMILNSTLDCCVPTSLRVSYGT